MALLASRGPHSVSIEPSSMGIYKSVAFEVFKRRPSVLIALDGNSSGANMIQDAKNGKQNMPRVRPQQTVHAARKAKNLEGVSLFEADDDLAVLSLRCRRDLLSRTLAPPGVKAGSF